MNKKIFINAEIVDVLQQTVYAGWFSVVKDEFEFVESGTYDQGLNGEIVDLDGKHVVPGLIDTHMHIESSLATPSRFVEEVMKHGTAAVLQDPHEMANIFGRGGIEFMINNSENQPVEIFTAIPSCVPSTRLPVETPNSTITWRDIKELVKYKSVFALGEVMDYNSVLEKNEEIMKMIDQSKKCDLSLEGHCPSLTGEMLTEYCKTGIRSNHCLTDPSKMQEQLRKGLWIMLQAKSITKENIEFVNSLKDRSRILFVTDDIFPDRLINGHLNSIVTLAINNGMEPIDAISSATLRPSEYLNLRDYGLIAPGYKASFFTVKSLYNIIPDNIFLKGKSISEIVLPATKEKEKYTFRTNIKEIKESDFVLSNIHGEKLTRVITMNTNNSETHLTEQLINFSRGVPNLLNTDILQVNVISRKASNFNPNPGFLKNLGLKNGAFASSFSHDSHNLFVIGKEHGFMAAAINKVIENKGGMVLTIDDKEYSIPLQIGGVITDFPVKDTARMQVIFNRELEKSGFEHRNPLLFLSVLTLAVSPYYKISDLGLVDTEKGKILNIFPGEKG